MDKLQYFKNKLKQILNSQANDILNDKSESTFKKSIAKEESIISILQKGGYPAGTVRNWKGKDYKKMSNGKWLRQYSSETKGIIRAIRALKSRIDAVETIEELQKLITEHKSRFVDKDGKELPVVKELNDYVSSYKTTTKTPKTTSGVEAIKQKYEQSKTTTGDTDEIYVGENAIKGTWKLVEADTPTASHDENTFSKTENFPKSKDGGTINDRDYEHDRQAQEIVLSIATNFDGRAVSFDNPVILTTDGVVISGNNRTMSSKLAAQKGTDKKYIEALENRAKKFGFTKDEVASYKNPRVVFEVEAPQEYNTQEFSKYNEQTSKTMSPIEQAVKVSKLMNDTTLGYIADEVKEFDTMGELYANKKAVNDIFNNLQTSGIINEMTRPQFVSDDGITGAGKEFLETVLIGSVVNENNIRALSKDGAKSIRRKLARAITPLVQNKGMKGYSINNELNEAIQIAVYVSTSKDKIKNIDEYAKQRQLFGDDSKISLEFAKMLEGTEKGFAEKMQKLNASLKYGADGQADIFLGGVETRADILDRFFSISKSIVSRVIDRLLNKPVDEIEPIKGNGGGLFNKHELEERGRKHFIDLYVKYTDYPTDEVIQAFNQYKITHAIPTYNTEWLFSANELFAGMFVEEEHTENYRIRLQISLDHLFENSNYYYQLCKCGIADEKEAYLLFPDIVMTEAMMAKAMTEYKPDADFAEAITKMFMDEKSNSINVRENRYKIRDLEGFPKGVDLENAEVVFIDRDEMTVAAGGDWQQMVNITIGIKDGKLKVISLYDYRDKYKASELKERLVAIENKSTMTKSKTFSGYPLQGRTKYKGLSISIENKKGSTRSGVDGDGHEWSIPMHYDYGYIKMTEGTDGDHVDVYLGDNDDANRAFIIHQNNPTTNKYDEDKVMLGFSSADEAKKAYLKQYDRPGFYGSMDVVDFDTFKSYVTDKDNWGKKIKVKSGKTSTVNKG